LGRAEDATDVARKMIATLAGLRTLAGQELRVTVTIGISVFPDDGQEPETLLKCADLALYRAKAQGQGRYAFFQSELNLHWQTD
jgi:diguanylate cyclase (GGDEF)-like protein